MCYIGLGEILSQLNIYFNTHQQMFLIEFEVRSKFHWWDGCQVVGGQRVLSQPPPRNSGPQSADVSAFPNRDLTGVARAWQGGSGREQQQQ